MLKAKTRYTVKHFRQIVWNGRTFAVIIILYATFILNLAFAGRLLTAGKYGANVDMPLGLEAVFILLSALFLIYLTFFYEKTLFKRYQRIYPNNIINCTFDENGFTIDECGDTNNSHQRLSYSMCFKAIENREWFVIYISRTSAHIIKKSEIINGTPEELRQLLTENLGNSFKIRRMI